MTKTLIICLCGGGPAMVEWNASHRDKTSRLGEITGATGDGTLWSDLLGRLNRGTGELGLINYPVEADDPDRLRLYVPRASLAEPRRWAMPKTLRSDLADYHDGSRPAGNPKLFKDHEQVFAEQAAAARIISEHVARLTPAHGPEIVCLGFGGLSLIRGLSGLHDGYQGLYIDQVMHHSEMLIRRLGAATLLCLADGQRDRPPLALHIAAADAGPRPGSSALSIEDIANLAAGG